MQNTVEDCHAALQLLRFRAVDSVSMMLDLVLWAKVQEVVLWPGLFCLRGIAS
jgi:hypothetical protein